MKNKFKNAVDLVLWAMMWLLPFFAFFVSWYRVGSAPAILTFIDEQFAFAYVKDLINKVWSLCFGSELAFAGYISYVVSVEIVHCLFDAIAFIPRFAHNLLERSESLFCKKD